MTTEFVAIRELVSDIIGGGWGEDVHAEGLSAVHIVRGADFPSAAKRDIRQTPRRFEPPKRIAGRRLIAGDIVLEVSGGTKERPTGRVVFMTADMLSQVTPDVIPASFCRRLRPRSERVDAQYLFYWLCDMYTKGRTWAYQVQSTGIANFQMERFLDAELVRVPPLDEQCRIAKALGAFESLIEVNRRLIAQIEELQLARFMQVWDGSRVRLGDVATITMGQSPPGSSYNENNDGTVFYQGVRDFGDKFPSRRVWTTQPTRFAERGDILTAVRAPVGRLNVALERTALGRGLGGLRSASQATLFQALQADAALWDIHQSTGTVFAAINKREMARLMIPWVADDGLDAELQAFDDQIVASTEEIRDLTRTRNELLPVLMSGAVEVSDVAELVST